MRSIRSWWDLKSAGRRLMPRSNGVRVRRGTAAHIKAGNLARDRRDWSAAAHAYRAAVTGEPQLQHLWVQLGHMEKEGGAVERATDAYVEAARLAPHDVEPLLLLGHMAKGWRGPTEAAGHFVEVLERDSSNLEAMSELVRLLPERADVSLDWWAIIRNVLDIAFDERASDDNGRLSSGAMLFDVTDLVAFFGRHRLPTGIQRVQIEVTLACLARRSDIPSIFCLYSSGRRGWIALPHDRFEALCRLARQSDDIGDLAWTDQLKQLYRHIVVAPTVKFAAATVMVNLGTSWADRNHLLDVRLIRARDEVVYVSLVFDLIPLIRPDWFIDTLVRDYHSWFGSLLHSADGFLAISKATRRDLLRVSAIWQAPVPASAIPVVRLDGDFRQAAADGASLQAYGLAPGGYVLLVSTLEPRKNHRGAFAAWLALVEALGEAAVPPLVCVGGRGWLNEDLHRMLRDNPSLQRKILILHGIPDTILAALYEHCLFALYPSFYEGWGLPVSEALSYGKVPAISRVSSLPEAGGPHARYFDPGNPAEIADTVRALLDDPVRHAAEAAIAREYSPRSWHDIAHEIVTQARGVASRVDDTLPCLETAGTWTFALPPQGDATDGTELPMQTGETLRHGRSWQSPGMTGCRIDGDDAMLWFRWAGPRGAMLHIHLAAGPSSAEVALKFGDVHRKYPVRPGVAETLSCLLPDDAVTVRIALTPVAGAIVVERIEISCGDFASRGPVSAPAAA